MRHLDLTHDGLLVVQELLYWMYTSDYSDRQNFFPCYREKDEREQ
jgi:hypothetical protein